MIVAKLLMYGKDLYRSFLFLCKIIIDRGERDDKSF